MLLDAEILKTIPEGQLMEWARVNGCDMQAFNVVHEAWVAANTTTTNYSLSETSED